ncbi:MAG: aminotransferase class V-fold PLP-dependent enzyme [Bacteroidales bacterium]|jgi:cysteine desulfurase/selenocysteine lyase|nr:aminotransferase class V-fold PLP-dependent enzyme [Bacteroidales bacterium]MCI2122424.1 aminotransferase class V-fold PLP-dependent enzyme [Bacteroidales bacterium]MCI2145007.1 aminotransferase class V-fold PLP-dependent enzyme [Bacteroidales bacterium]
MDTIDKIRARFPALQQSVYGKPLVYFDNAATSQRPDTVLVMQQEMSSRFNANIHRAVHYLSSVATDRYEAGREAVRKYIDAGSREEVVFTSGCTASLNLVATCFTERYVGKGDVVLISGAEHHSNIVPWQMACRRVGAELKVFPVLPDGSLDLEALKSMLDVQYAGRVRIVAMTQISNVLGVVNDIAGAARICHAAGVPILVDGAQGIVHSPVSVSNADVDFFAFSGHKVYAPTGIGVLYGKKKYLEEMPPYMGGGDMIDKVTYEKTTYAPLPLKYEAGTANFVAASCLAPAMDFAGECESDIDVRRSMSSMTDYLMTELPKIDGLTIYGTADAKAPVFSFAIKGCHHEDLAQIMDKMGVALRSGHMCAEPLINSLGHTGLLRASLAPYNTMEECEYFIGALKKAVSMLR